MNLFVESMFFDVDVAFPNVTLKEDVHIDPPAGYSPVAKGLVLKLNKALYELNEALDNFLAGGSYDD